MKLYAFSLLLLSVPCVAGAREAWEILGAKETEQFILASESADVTGVTLSFSSELDASSFTVITTDEVRKLPSESLADLKDVLTRGMPDSTDRISSGFRPRFRVRLFLGEEHLDILIEGGLNGFVVWKEERASGGRGGMDGYRPIFKRALKRCYSDSELSRLTKTPNKMPEPTPDGVAHR